MIEDRLSHDERLRLECVAQANMSVAAKMESMSAAELVVIASVFEDYVREGLSDP